MGILIILLLLVKPLLAAPAPDDAAGPWFAGTPCTDQERWTLSEDFPEEARQAITALTERRGIPVIAFAEALAVRQRSFTDDTRSTTEYFISRAMYEAGLLHVAHSGFTSILRRPPSQETFHAQVASLSCLERIETKVPSLSIPIEADSIIRSHLTQKIAPHLAHYPNLLRTSAYRRAEASLRSPSEVERARALLALLTPGSVEHQLTTARIAIRDGNLGSAIGPLKNALAQTPWPSHLQSEKDDARVMLGRALYSNKRFGEAIQAFRSVEKSSNLLSTSLSDLSWSQLAAENYNDAIGTALSLRTGNMKSTFTPEAQMVMAMALNEICQFPESLKAIRQFKKDYGESYTWLKKWRSDRTPLYPALIALLKNDARLPVRIGTELLSSRVFLSYQDELNLLIDEKKHSIDLARSGASEQRKIGVEILTRTKELQSAVAQARRELDENDPLPEKVRLQLAAFRKLVNRYLRIQRAAGPWQSILASHERSAPIRRGTLKSHIENDLIQRTERMLAQLEEISENNQLIEIEILNGASKDLVWQNANPDFQRVARKLATDEQKNKAAPGQAQSWGKASAWDDAEKAEIWEDELGSFKTDLIDNCSSKDKYLAIRREESRS